MAVAIIILIQAVNYWCAIQINISKYWYFHSILWYGLSNFIHKSNYNKLVCITLIDFFYHFLTTTTKQDIYLHFISIFNYCFEYCDTVSYHDIFGSNTQYSFLAISHIPAWPSHIHNQIYIISLISSIRCQNYTANIEYVTPSLLAQVELEFQSISKWTLNLLRTTTIDTQQNFDYVLENKPPGVDCKLLHIYCTMCTCISRKKASLWLLCGVSLLWLTFLCLVIFLTLLLLFDVSCRTL